MSGPRFFTTALIERPAFNEFGDRVYSTVASGVSFSFWDRRRKSVIAGTGEELDVIAQGFLPSGTDIRVRDRITSLGRAFDVVTLVSGRDDRGRLNHLGVELRDI